MTWNFWVEEKLKLSKQQAELTRTKIIHGRTNENVVAIVKAKGKDAYSSLWIGNPSQSYGASPAIWVHPCYLPPDTGERAPL